MNLSKQKVSGRRAMRTGVVAPVVAVTLALAAAPSFAGSHGSGQFKSRVSVAGSHVIANGSRGSR